VVGAGQFGTYTNNLGFPGVFAVDLCLLNRKVRIRAREHPRSGILLPQRQLERLGLNSQRSLPGGAGFVLTQPTLKLALKHVFEVLCLHLLPVVQVERKPSHRSKTFEISSGKWYFNRGLQSFLNFTDSRDLLAFELLVSLAHRTSRRCLLTQSLLVDDFEATSLAHIVFK